MKCPECGHNQKVKDGLRCSSCRYEFVFNPKYDTGQMTDGKFVACIRAASQNDTVWYTENQLYAAFCRRVTRVSKAGCVVSVVLLVVGVLVATFVFVPFGLLLIVGGIFALLGGFFARLTRGGKAKRDVFERHYKKWKGSGKKLEKLIQQPSLHTPPPDWKEPDIYDYGVERLLLVERDLLVDLLVKNGVHAEQRMAVLAESGYPKYLLPVAQRLLVDQPDLPVFLLHDATPEGMKMKDRVLAGRPLDVSGHPITDLGMFPDDFQKLDRTAYFDPDDRARALPADALLLPMMTAGLTAAMVDAIPLGEVIDDPARRKGNDSTSFG